MAKSVGAFKQDLLKFYAIDFQGRRPSFAQKLWYWLCCFSLHCVAIYRFEAWSKRLFKRIKIVGIFPLIPAEILAYYVRMIHHMDFFAAEIGPGFYIAHAGPIYIGPCIVGANFSVTHNVTLGVSNAEGMEGMPRIGANVWIGTGSVVYGNAAIGNGVTVNAGSILTRPVPDRCLVGGNPARILQQDYDNTKLFGGYVSIDPTPIPPARETPVTAAPTPEPST